MGGGSNPITPPPSGYASEVEIMHVWSFSPWQLVSRFSFQISRYSRILGVHVRSSGARWKSHLVGRGCAGTWLPVRSWWPCRRRRRRDWVVVLVPIKSRHRPPKRLLTFTRCPVTRPSTLYPPDPVVKATDVRGLESHGQPEATHIDRRVRTFAPPPETDAPLPQLKAISYTF